MDTPRNLAVFVDYDNIGLGELSIARILEPLSSRGRLLIKRAYGDWKAGTANKQQLARAAFDLIELPSNARGKNRGDIRIAVDVMEIALTRPYVDTFAIASGDSDFLPLISKLRELNKRVIVLARRGNASGMLEAGCDELLFLNEAPAKKTPAPTSPPDEKMTILLSRIRLALRRLESRGVLALLPRVKDELVRIDPSFNLKAYGHTKFKTLLEQFVKKGSLRFVPRDPSKSVGKKASDMEVYLQEVGPRHPLPTGLESAEKSEQPRKGAKSRPEKPLDSADQQPAEMPENEASPAAAAPPDSENASSGAAASEGSPPAGEGVPDELLDRIYWACAIRLPHPFAPISLGSLAGGFRKLYPGVRPRDFGFPNAGGFLKMLLVMELENYCAIERQGKSTYSVVFTPKFFERTVELPKPDQVESDDVLTAPSPPTILSFPTLRRHAPENDDAAERPVLGNGKVRESNKDTQPRGSDERDGWLPF